ncbi:MAG: right-handed parallel beta-helix repeat-containing protein [Rhodobacteraceae bacterium]|nr:right-handed parallel beta-helix repeat-containing protein [Paracoccaceae bacterium]
MRLVLQACVLALGLTQPAAAAPDPQIIDLRKKIEALDTALNGGASLQVPNVDLVDKVGLTHVTKPEMFPALGAAYDWTATGNVLPEVERLDLRLALAMLAQTYGAKDNFDVIQAQGGDMDALSIRKGVVTLPDLHKLLENNKFSSDLSPGGVTLKTPVIIWTDATLRLRPREILQLSRPDGAFIVVFGKIEINGATVRSVGPQSVNSKDFVPFVTVTGGGSAHVANATFEDLGFGGEPKYSGFSIARNPLLPTTGEIHIENSVFDRVVSLAVNASRGATILGNKFHDTRGSSLIVSQSSDARILGNIFSGEAPTNGIRVLSGSARGVIRGNLLLNGERTGIAIRNASDQVLVENNIVWSRGGGGITLTKTNCGLIQNNLVMDNKQKGIEIRTGLGNVVINNKIYKNRSAALFVSAQPHGALTVMRNNRLVGNQSGLATAEGEFVELEGNDFSRQFPRFLDGELSSHTRHIAQNMRGAERVVMTSFGPSDAPLNPFMCPER